MSKGITNIDISAIKPNPNNPRKSFDEVALSELATSIKELGVLQPIIVRTLDSGYQLVCGERRWRASQIAELTTIPAIVRTLTDEEAMDLAITENLQRKDVSPIEEAKAFSYLTRSGKSIDELCARFGKSESYVRLRLKLCHLTAYFMTALEKGEISHSVAQVVARFDTETQVQIEGRFNQDYQPWSVYNAKELLERINDYILPSINDAEFDTTECAKCCDNTATQSLFAEDEAPCCMRIACYHKKKAKWLASEAVKLANTSGGIEQVFVSEELDSEALEIIISAGLSVVEVPSIYSLTTIKDDDVVEYYIGGVEMGIVMFSKHCSVVIAPNATVPDTSKPSAVNIIEKRNDLTKQITRKREIRDEKTIEEVNEFVKQLDFTKMRDCTLEPIEDKLAMFFLINSISYFNAIIIAKEFGMETQCNGLSTSDCWALSQQLTSTSAPIAEVNCKRAFIYRLIIRDKLLRHQPGLINDKIFDWVDLHNPGTTAEIKLKYQETYLKSKERLEARIAELKLEE
ncbi:MAG: ParB/RepB/Spo0J family partition protein [Rikenellaceae bacterium]